MNPQNYKVWLTEVRKLLNSPDLSDNYSNLYSLAFDIRRFRKSLNHNVGDVHKLLDVMRLLRDAKGGGRGVFEERTKLVDVTYARRETSSMGIRSLSHRRQRTGMFVKDQHVYFAIRSRA